MPSLPSLHSLPFLSESGGAVQVAIHAQPRASRSRLAGVHDGRLKVQLAAPPVDGEANAELLELFSKVLGIPRRQLALASGETGKRKLLRVEGLSLAEVEQRLGGVLP